MTTNFTLRGGSDILLGVPHSFFYNIIIIIIIVIIIIIIITFIEILTYAEHTRSDSGV